MLLDTELLCAKSTVPCELHEQVPGIPFQLGTELYNKKIILSLIGYSCYLKL
jgi:hypothetical protein